MIKKINNKSNVQSSVKRDHRNTKQAEPMKHGNSVRENQLIIHQNYTEKRRCPGNQST